MSLARGSSGAWSRGEPPSPDGARTFDELAARLRALLTWAGVSYRELHRRIVRSRRARGVAELPVYNTVYRCLQSGRRRMDVELVADIVWVLLTDEAAAEQWRQAHRFVAGRTADSAMVTVAFTLPDDDTDFVGRRVELSILLGAEGNTPAVSIIEGMAGVGKTTLAVRVAHALARPGRSGDVRLWADLRGYDAERAPADPGAVLDGFLRKLGVPGNQIHRLSLDRRMARYRQLLAGRRAVIVLDNAATEGQVRPLVPDGPGCRVLVTSRRELAGLPCGQRVCLDAFTAAESMDLLRRRVGADTINADAGAASRIAELVGHLPLALAVVASRIQTSPDWTLRDHVERLAERRTGLRVEDELATAVGLSYLDIPAEVQRLLRLLAIHPGRDFDSRAAAALADTHHDTTVRQLGSLVAGNLVQQRSAWRFGMHDVIRVFAGDMAHDVDAASVRSAALDRLLGYYRYAAAMAMDRYAPLECDRRPAVPVPETPPPEFTDRASAIEWLDAERENLLATAVHASERGRHDHAAVLSLILARYLYDSAHHRDAEILHGLAVRAGDSLSRAHAHKHLAVVYLWTDRYAESIEHLQQALAIFEEAGDRINRARALNNLGNSHERLGNYSDALSCYQQALPVFREFGDRISEARVLGNLGLIHLRLGQLAESTERYLRSLAIRREVGDRPGEGWVLGNLGSVYERQGHHVEALDCYQRSLDISREVGHVVGEADVLRRLGSGLARTGQPEVALAHYERALGLAHQEGMGVLEVQTLNGLGGLLRSMGRHSDALARHREALALAEALGDRYEHAYAHDGIAGDWAAAGDTAAARDHWRRALTLYTELGTPEAEAIARRLTGAAQLPTLS